LSGETIIPKLTRPVFALQRHRPLFSRLLGAGISVFILWRRSNGATTKKNECRKTGGNTGTFEAETGRAGHRGQNRRTCAAVYGGGRRGYPSSFPRRSYQEP